MKKQLFRGIAILSVIALFMVSCKKETFTVSGIVTNVTDIAVANATVNIYTSGTSEVLYSATTNDLGQYSLTGVESGSYDMGISAPGYSENILSVSITQEFTQDIDLVGAASLYGSIIDSQTGSGMSGVTIAFTTDMTVTEVSAAQLITTTDGYGEYAINGAPTGTFRVIIDAPNYFVRILDGITIIEGANNMGDITSVAPPSEGSLRIILSWGVTPYDLDSHITGPDGFGSRFHVCYWNETSADQSVDLDVDDTDSYGPETVTINAFLSGTYRYSVHNYSDQSTTGGSGIASSPARVEVYDASGLKSAFQAPAFSGTGNTWRVFEIEVSGTTATIVPVNTYVYAEDDDDINIFQSATTKSPESKVK